MSPHMELVRGPEPMKPWWESVAEVHLLLAWLVETTRVTTLDEALYFVGKPHKWAAERELMLQEEAQQRIADEHVALEDDAWRDMERRSSL